MTVKSSLTMAACGVAIVLGGMWCVSWAAPAAKTSDWPQWRGPNGNGVTSETLSATFPKDGPKKLWEAKVGDGKSSMIISGGKLFTQGNAKEGETLYCFDAASGEGLWKTALPVADPPRKGGGAISTPATDGKLIFATTGIGVLAAVDLTGKVVWSVDMVKDLAAPNGTYGFTAAPLLVGDVLIAPDAGVGLDKNTGKVVWKNENATFGNGNCSPVVMTIGGKAAVVVHASAGKELAAIDASTGKDVWRVALKALHYGDPVVLDEKTVYFSGRVVHIDGDKVTVDPARHPSFEWGQASLYNGCLYGLDAKTGDAKESAGMTFRCLDAKDLSEKWNKADLGGPWIIADGKLVMVTVEGELVIAEVPAAGYKELARVKLFDKGATYPKSGWPYPALVGGKLYCRSGVNMACLDVSGK